MDLTSKIEQALVGGLLQKPDKFIEISSIIKAEDFSCKKAMQSYLTAQNLWQEKKVVDLLSVAAVDMTLATYLSEALNIGTPIGLPSHAQTIANNAKKRRIISSLKKSLSETQQVDDLLTDILNLYQQEMTVSVKNPEIRAVVKRFNDHVVQNKKRKTMGVPTGYDFLDQLFVQYVPGQTWVIGAYTSVGKTAMMVQKVCNLLVMNSSPSIIIISTEMTEQQLVARIIANLTSIHSARILSGNFHTGEEEEVSRTLDLLKSKSLKIYDDIYAINEIESALRKADLQGGVDVVWIDYVQNCRVPEAANEYQAGSILAKRLQKLAKDTNCCIIGLSQISNSVARGATDQLEFKGAGEWAAVADIGIHLQKKKESKHILRYLIKKNRHGGLHNHSFEYKMDFTRLEAIGPIKDKDLK